MAHLLRILQEGHLATDPVYLLITVTAAALSLWAWRVIRRTTRQ